MWRLTDRLRRVSARERERRLVQASSDYMAGRISLAQLRRTERRYGTNYRAIAHTLARIADGRR